MNAYVALDETLHDVLLPYEMVAWASFLGPRRPNANQRSWVHAGARAGDFPVEFMRQTPCTGQRALTAWLHLQRCGFEAREGSLQTMGYAGPPVVNGSGWNPESAPLGCFYRETACGESVVWPEPLMRVERQFWRPLALVVGQQSGHKRWSVLCWAGEEAPPWCDLPLTLVEDLSGLSRTIGDDLLPRQTPCSR